MDGNKKRIVIIVGIIVALIAFVIFSFVSYSNTQKQNELEAEAEQLAEQTQNPDGTVPQAGITLKDESGEVIEADSRVASYSEEIKKFSDELIKNQFVNRGGDGTLRFGEGVMSETKGDQIRSNKFVITSVSNNYVEGDEADVEEYLASVEIGTQVTTVKLTKTYMKNAQGMVDEKSKVNAVWVFRSDSLHWDKEYTSIKKEVKLEVSGPDASVFSDDVKKQISGYVKKSYPTVDSAVWNGTVVSNYVDMTHVLTINLNNMTSTTLNVVISMQDQKVEIRAV